LTNRTDPPEQAAELRRQAEALAREQEALSPNSLHELSLEETQQVLHELQVHQIELEMQNEELRRTQVALDETRARYFDLYDLAPVGYCSISEAGLIMESNLAAAELLDTARSALISQPISRFILHEDQDIYYRHRKQLVETGAKQICELRMVKSTGTPFWARLVSAAAQETDGSFVSRVVMSSIQERKQAEAELQVLHAELEVRVKQRTTELAIATEALQIETVRRLHAEEKQLTAVLEERTRIAREIHDTLAQGFAGIIYQLEAAEAELADNPETALSHLVKARQLARVSLTDARRSMWALRPQLIESGDLVDAFGTITKNMASESAINVEFLVLGERCRLSKEAEEGLLRICQEALKKASKHSQAQHVRVLLAFSEEMVSLRIEDDGRGFDTASAPFFSGLGLRILKERATNMGGTVTITSQPGQGTQVAVQVPMSASPLG
jgi:PAS domain S-box-containing protein